MSETLSEKLDRLANFQAERTVLDLEKQELIDQVLTPEIKARLSEIEAEFLMKAEAVDANITTLEAEIRAAVLLHGASVKGEFLRAVWNKGRVSWDTHAMDQYAQAHPDVLRFRRQGEPFITITKSGG